MRKNILVILPEHGRMEILAASLVEMYGYKVFTAHNEPEAIALFFIHKIDLVVIEPVLPMKFLFEKHIKNVRGELEFGLVGFVFLEFLKEEIKNIQEQPEIIIFSIVDLPDLVSVGFDPRSHHVMRGSDSKGTLIEKIHTVLNPKYLLN